MVTCEMSTISIQRKKKYTCLCTADPTTRQPVTGSMSTFLLYLKENAHTFRLFFIQYIIKSISENNNKQIVKCDNEFIVHHIFINNNGTRCHNNHYVFAIYWLYKTHELLVLLFLMDVTFYLPYHPSWHDI